MFQSSLFLRGMESHHSIRKQLWQLTRSLHQKCKHDINILPILPVTPFARILPLRNWLLQLNYSHQPEFRWINNDHRNLRSSNTYAIKPLLFWQISVEIGKVPLKSSTCFWTVRKENKTKQQI